MSQSDVKAVIVYDLAAGKPKKTLTGFINPRNIVFHPDGKRMYISDSSLGLVLDFDTTTFVTKSSFLLGYGAFGTALSPDGRTLFVNNQAASTVTVVATDTGHAEAVITGFAQPRQGIRFSPDGSKGVRNQFHQR